MSVETQQINLRARVLPTAVGFSRPEQYIDPLRHNLTLVIGGEVKNEQGQGINVEGFLGRLVESTGQEIAQSKDLIAKAEESLVRAKLDTRGRIRLFGVTLRNPDLLRDAQREKEQVEKEKQSKLRVIGEPLKRQREKIEQFCKQENINPQLRNRFDSLVEVENYLANNSGDTESLLPHIKNLGWSVEDLSMQELQRKLKEDLAVLQRYGVTGYEGYKRLIVGYIQGEVRIKGLKDFDKDVQEAAKAFVQREQSSIARWNEVRERVGKYDQLRGEIKTNQARLTELRAQMRALTATASYLGEGFLPDPSVIINIGEQMNSAQQDLDQLREAERYAITQNRILRAAGQKVSSLEDNSRAKEIAQQRIKDLEKRLGVLVDPMQRILYSDGSEDKGFLRKFADKFLSRFKNESASKILPSELVNAARRLSRSNSIPRQEDVFGKILLVLSGKTNDLISLKMKDVTNDIPKPLPELPKSIKDGEEVVYSGSINLLHKEEEIPTVVPPVEEKPVEEENMEEPKVELSALQREQVFYQLMRGELSARQLLTLETDGLAYELNEKLLEQGKNFYPDTATDKIIAALLNSVKVAEGGERGIPRSWLPRLAVQSMLDAVNVLHEWTSRYNAGLIDDSTDKVDYWRNVHSQPLNINDLKKYLEEIQALDSDFSDKIQNALKRLAIIETSRQLLFGLEDESHVSKMAS